ncbi:MAG: hypothetical protein ACSLE5_15815 [Porticoccaceae bacterium]
METSWEQRRSHVKKECARDGVPATLAKLAEGHINGDDRLYAREFLEEEAASASAKRDAREASTLAIAKRAVEIAESANRIASEARDSERLQARWAIWAAIIAAVAAITANKDALIAWLG